MYWLCKRTCSYDQYNESYEFYESTPTYEERKIIKAPFHKEEDNSRKFNMFAQEHATGGNLIFTDASKGADQSVGIGVYGPGVEIKERLPEYASICTAETYAIFKALTVIERSNLKKTVIISDSQSALAKISSHSKPTDDFLTLVIKQKMEELKGMGFELKLMWIPSHTNIHGNDRADNLANEGRKEIDITPLPLDYREFLPYIRERLWSQWHIRWKTMSESKGKLYGDILQTPCRKTWFRDLKNLQRRDIVTLNRIRSGHCTHPVHLHRLRIKQDPLCECGEPGTLQHMLLECPNNHHFSHTLYRSIQQILGTSPISIIDIISSSPRIAVVVSKFLRDSSLQL